VHESLTLAPTPDPHVFAAPDGRRLSPPATWECLPPGDAGLTRRVKAVGPSWVVIEKRGRKLFSKGLWAPRENIKAARAALAAERSTATYAKKREADTARSERAHAAVSSCHDGARLPRTSTSSSRTHQATRSRSRRPTTTGRRSALGRSRIASSACPTATHQPARCARSDAHRHDDAKILVAAGRFDEAGVFLRFAPRWLELARAVAHLVAAHATPVGSGTVARTERIPIERRAEAAVIAWMRHQTTGYDDMTIQRVAGRRREVRRELAELSRAVLDLHRHDLPHAPAACSLCSAVDRERQLI
jgi:hypothetical protein